MDPSSSCLGRSSLYSLVILRWTGPIVRLVDTAHRVTEEFGTSDPQDLFEAYGIRAHLVIDIKLRGLQSNDPSF